MASWVFGTMETGNGMLLNITEPFADSANLLITMNDTE